MKGFATIGMTLAAAAVGVVGCKVIVKEPPQAEAGRPAVVDVPAAEPAPANPAPQAAVKPQAVEQLPRPRLFADEARMAEVRAFCETNELGRALASRICLRADRALAKEPVRRELDGRRMLAVSRTALDRILNLGVAWRLTGEKKYAARGIRELEAVCAFTDWNPQHYLDVGEMAFAASVAYDWFHAEIPAERRRALAAAIDARVFGPLFADQDMNWGGLKTTWWLEADNNWNSVCAAGTMVAARALWDDPEFADRAHAFGTDIGNYGTEKANGKIHRFGRIEPGAKADASPTEAGAPLLPFSHDTVFTKATNYGRNWDLLLGQTGNENCLADRTYRAVLAGDPFISPPLGERKVKGSSAAIVIGDFSKEVRK